jgi:hypothetical protein
MKRVNFANFLPQEMLSGHSGVQFMYFFALTGGACWGHYSP